MVGERTFCIYSGQKMRAKIEKEKKGRKCGTGKAVGNMILDEIERNPVENPLFS